MNIWWVSPFVILCKVCIHKCKCPLGTSLNSYEMRSQTYKFFWDKLLQQIGPAAWLPKGHLSTNWWLVLKLIVPLQTFCYQNAPGTTILHNVFTEWSAVNFYPSWVSKVHSPTSDTVFLSLLCLLQCRQRQKIWKWVWCEFSGLSKFLHWKFEFGTQHSSVTLLQPFLFSLGCTLFVPPSRCQVQKAWKSLLHPSSSTLTSKSTVGK